MARVGPLAVAALLGCGDSGGDVVAGSAEATRETWTVEPFLVVSAAEVDGDPRYLFQDVAAARLFDDGRVAVADRGYGSVRVFEPDGVFAAEIGQPGEGPGEFSYINDMLLRTSDTIEVYDSGHFRLTRFTAAGDLISMTSIDREGGRPEVYLGRFDNGDLGFAWIVATPRGSNDVAPDQMDVGRFRAAGSFDRVLGRATGMRRFGNGPTPFSPFLHAFVSRDSVFFTDGLSEMTVLPGGGGAARTFGLPTPTITYREAASRVTPILQVSDEPWQLERLSEVPLTEPVPRVAEVLLDDAGHFWLKEYVPESDSHLIAPSFGKVGGGTWWIYHPDAGVVARVELPDDLTPLDVRGDLLVGARRDALDVERVAVYRLVRS